MIEKFGEYRKAIAAFLVPALVALGLALTADSNGVVAVTAAEWVGIAIAALGTSAVVAGVSNKTYTGGVN
jgi:long-subunit acyl-CoA synthetase (AMP-forming)